MTTIFFDQRCKNFNVREERDKRALASLIGLHVLIAKMHLCRNERFEILIYEKTNSLVSNTQCRSWHISMYTVQCTDVAAEFLWLMIMLHNLRRIIKTV